MGKTYLIALGVALLTVGCDDKPSKPLAPTASALAPADKPAGATTLKVESKGSKVEFLMNAPIEKINGVVEDGAEGEINVDPKDVSKTTALIKVDLDKLTLYQQKREDEKGEFSERAKNDQQNAHARNWLEISEDAPKDKREENRWAEFKIERVVEPTAKDLTTMKGAERKVTGWATGEFRLHGRKQEKRVKIEASFEFDGDKLTGVKVKTLEPMNVGLEEFDVKPREAFGKLAQKTLGALGNKVAQEAPIELTLSAKAK
ncbi:MAG: YceI family protein [Myxococcales bacterium]|nr:YceI family protein [Myxococcales bacterium]MCB9582638.1 YceI family protein [Polyangiaceae bacterium]